MCSLVTATSCAKVKMPLGVCTWVGPRNHVSWANSYRVLALRLKLLRVRVPAIVLVGNNLRQVVRTRASHQAVYFTTGQGTVMPCVWESNRRFSVTYSTCHESQT